MRRENLIRVTPSRVKNCIHEQLFIIEWRKKHNMQHKVKIKTIKDELCIVRIIFIFTTTVNSSLIRSQTNRSNIYKKIKIARKRRKE